MHHAAPSAEVKPEETAPHSKHSVVPVVGLYFPASHILHPVVVRSGVKPGGHCETKKQSVLEVLATGESNPGAQNVQSCGPIVFLYVPVVHATHGGNP